MAFGRCLGRRDGCGSWRYDRRVPGLPVGADWFHDTRAVVCVPMFMKLPHAIATLLYGFNEQDEVLLMHRRRPPNEGLWSPPGGKLKADIGESPHACACREAHEELGMDLCPRDLRLTGIVSEHGYEGQRHWLMFLFEILPRLDRLPPAHDEGEFAFASREDLDRFAIPASDRECLWPAFWTHRGGFFAVHGRCRPDGPTVWTPEESRPARE